MYDLANLFEKDFTYPGKNEFKTMGRINSDQDPPSYQKILSEKSKTNLAQMEPIDEEEPDQVVEVPRNIPSFIVYDVINDASGKLKPRVLETRIQQKDHNLDYCNQQDSLIRATESELANQLINTSEDKSQLSRGEKDASNSELQIPDKGRQFSSQLSSQLEQPQPSDSLEERYRNQKSNQAPTILFKEQAEDASRESTSQGAGDSQLEKYKSIQNQNSSQLPFNALPTFIQRNDEEDTGSKVRFTLAVTPLRCVFAAYSPALIT